MMLISRNVLQLKKTVNEKFYYVPYVEIINITSIAS